jgi:hypothetical protein
MAKVSARWLAAIGVVAVTGGVVAAVTAGGSSNPSSPSGTSSAAGGSDPVATAPVVRTTLTSTVQVGGAIGYGGSYTITAPSPGTSTQATTDQQTVTTDQQTVSADEASLSADQQTVSGDEQTESDAASTGRQTIAADQANVRTDQETLTTDENKQAQDCAVTSSTVTGPDTTACTADETAVGTDKTTLTAARQKLAADQLAAKTTDDQDQAKVASDKVKVQGDQGKLRADQTKLGEDQGTLGSLRATAANPGTTYTWLPQAGQVIGQDQPAYSVSGGPVPLLYGAVPAYRAFYLGMSDGGDVGELTHDLIALGYGGGLAQSNHYSAATAAAVRRWQSKRGLPATGAILLGGVVFEPGPIRVTSVTPSQGAPVSAGTVLTATGVNPVVSVDLDVDQEYLIKPGDGVSVVLPDGSTTVGGQVESVGTVATCPGGGGTGTAAGGTGSGGGGSADQSPCSSAGSGGSGGTSSTPQVTVTITLNSTPPQARLDQAPVNVNITEYKAVNVLAAPVNALLALSGGGYAVQVVAGGTSHLVGVSTGLYSDTLVQISGPGITAGTLVQVPSP